MICRWILSGCLLVALPVRAEDPSPTAFESVEEVQDWSAAYHAKPEPARVVLALQCLAGAGVLDRPSGHPGLVAFFGRVFRDHRDRLTGWLHELDGVKPAQRMFLWQCAWMSRSEEGKAVLREARQVASPENAMFLDQLLDREPPDPAVMELGSPLVLQAIWGTFHATGDAGLVRRIVLAVDGIASADPARQVVARAARDGLLQHAARDEIVRRTCEEEIPKLGDDGRRVLLEVIEQARPSGK